jgi:hypothetical protein
MPLAGLRISRVLGRIGDMPNGKPGDHPLTDIVVHGMEVFGTPCDELIREINGRPGGPTALGRLNLDTLAPRLGGRPGHPALEAALRNIQRRLPSE